MDKPTQGRWGLYARFSDPKQADGLTIEAQLNQLRTWAEQKGHACCEYVDAGKSAWTENLKKRPRFLEMLEAARAGRISGIAVTHIDRFSRKLIVTLSVLGELGQRGVGFVSLENSAFDFSRPADKLLLSVLGAFAEYYSAELSRKVHRGMTTRANKGLHVGTLPFGYCNGHCIDCKQEADGVNRCKRWGSVTKDSPPVVHPDDALGVRLAYDTYLAGNVSDEDVAHLLNAAGYRSRSSKGRVLWNRWSVATLLSNPTYTGVVPYQGQEIPGTHSVIIPRATFEKVQSIRKQRFHRQRIYHPKFRVYLFNGILVCAGCGHKMRAQAFGSSETMTYRCTARESKKWQCSQMAGHVREEALADQFSGLVAQFRLPEDWLARVNELVNAHTSTQDSEAKRRALNERLARLKLQFEWSDIGEAEYTTKREEIKRALAELEPPLAADIADAAQYLRSMTEVWSCASKLEQRDMIRAIFDLILCDMDAGHLTALHPKPAFRHLLGQVPGLHERDGSFEVATNTGHPTG